MDNLKDYETMYGRTDFSVLFIDPENIFDLNQYCNYCPGKNMLYIDLAQVKKGDYNSISTDLANNKYDGLMFDNVDKIPRTKEKEYWQYLIKYALKKEEFPLAYPLKGEINFENLITVCRCSEYPRYIDPRVIMGVQVDLNS